MYSSIRKERNMLRPVPYANRGRSLQLMVQFSLGTNSEDTDGFI